MSPVTHTHVGTKSAQPRAYIRSGTSPRRKKPWHGHTRRGGEAPSGGFTDQCRGCAVFAHRLSTVVVSIVPGIGLAFPAQASAPAAARESSSPKTNVSAVRLTLTVVDPTHAGGIVVFHGGHDGKRISSVPFRPERTVGRVIVAPVGADGSIRLVNGSAGTVQLDADVAGYCRTDVT